MTPRAAAACAAAAQLARTLLDYLHATYARQAASRVACPTLTVLPWRGATVMGRASKGGGGTSSWRERGDKQPLSTPAP